MARKRHAIGYLFSIESILAVLLGRIVKFRQLQLATKLSRAACHESKKLPYQTSFCMRRECNPGPLNRIYRGKCRTYRTLTAIRLLNLARMEYSIGVVVVRRGRFWSRSDHAQTLTGVWDSNKARHTHCELSTRVPLLGC